MSNYERQYGEPPADEAALYVIEQRKDGGAWQLTGRYFFHHGIDVAYLQTSFIEAGGPRQGWEYRIVSEDGNELATF